MGLHSTVVLLGLLMMAGGAVLFFATQHKKLGLTLAAVGLFLAAVSVLSATLLWASGM
jgi:hypothetical protein